MATIVGDIKGLKASNKADLERLSTRRGNARNLVDPDLARRAAALSAELGLQLGMLIGRDGEITHLIVGSKNRIYLPDLGRFRLDSVRLRRLRLVVFIPSVENSQSSLVATFKSKPENKLPRDLITDLEKLRLDALVVCHVFADGRLANLNFCYLQPVAVNPKLAAAKAPTEIVYEEYRDPQDIELDFGSFVKELESQFEASRHRTFDTSKDAALLIGVYTGSAGAIQASMDELRELVRTAEISELDSVIQRRKEIDPRTIVGKGKLEEIVLHSLDLGADLLIFDHELTPGQLRNITNLTELRVIDRSMLILDIFAQRAKTSEGRLQVELAQLKYSLPRLHEKESGLSRLSGGIGGRGPGETKLEVSRRRVRDRIALLEKKIDNVSKQRGVRRERRQAKGVPVIAIVGYTNAGKSTLLNALTKGDVFVENKLFATLDPSSRRMRFPNDREVVFVDTVGFIRDLPKELVAAFRATLEEVGEADVLIHLVDMSNPDFERQIKVVEETLESLDFGQKPRITVFNKLDLLSEMEAKAIQSQYSALGVSAVSRLGLSELLLKLQDELARPFEIRVTPPTSHDVSKPLES